MVLRSSAARPRVLAAAAVFAGGLLGATGSASAEARPYRGPHPVDVDGHWHEEESVHVHDLLPVGLGPFAEVDGVMIFLGDPRAYGWQGPVYEYRGAHPLPARVGGYCGLTGGHRHPFAPEGDYRVLDGVNRYAGALRGGVGIHRPGQLAPDEAADVAPLLPPSTVVAQPYFWPPVCGAFTEVLRDGRTLTHSFGPCAAASRPPRSSSRRTPPRPPPARARRHPAPASSERSATRPPRNRSRAVVPPVLPRRTQPRRGTP